jgi:hypothetical protein
MNGSYIGVEESARERNRKYICGRRREITVS